MPSLTLISSLLGKQSDITPYPDPLPHAETEPHTPTSARREGAVDDRPRRRHSQPVDIWQDAPAQLYAVLNVGSAAGDDISHLMEDVLSQNLRPYYYYDILRRICACVDARSKNALLATEELGLCFSYGNTARKLRAARLWAIMLRYCSSEALARETSSKWFLRPVKAICLDEAGHPGLYTRTREIVAGAALLYPDRAFADLWKSLKRKEEPAEGIPFRNPLFIIPKVLPSGAHGPMDEAMSPPTSPLIESPQSELAPYREFHAAPAPPLSPKSIAKPSTSRGILRPLSIASVASAATTLPPYSEERCFIIDEGIDSPSVAPPKYD